MGATFAKHTIKGNDWKFRILLMAALCDSIYFVKLIYIYVVS